LTSNRRFSTLGDVNQLFFGDNLNVLREHIQAESVDLIYLDPPFNSKRDYNLLFKSPKGHESEAQITAFEDSWHWGEQAEREFDELVHAPNTAVSEMMQALRRFLGENDMMAYLTMMANRLLELHRVLKPTGSLYLHCDPTASHYLKIVLDGVFGKVNMVNEIVWKRSDAHSDAKQGATHLGRIHDTIFRYQKTDQPIFNALYTPLPQSTIDSWYRNVEPETGRRFNKADITGPGGAGKGNPHYEWKGVLKYWRFTKAKMEELDAQGRIVYSKSGMPYQKRYLDESKGVPVQDFWDDISMLRGISDDGERLGYPTQKPLALLERIISISSNEGDVVLDPFCGCGTAVHAAQKLNRQWLGIDITHLAISLIEKRLKDSFGAKCKFEVHGTPKDLDAARNLAMRDKYQFQWWAVSLVDAQPFQGKKKGADGGIDGLKFFGDYVIEDKKKTGKHDQVFKTCKIVVSVKGGGIKADDVRSLMAVREREGAEIALFVSLDEPTRGMIADAASAGFYESATGKKYPRVQLLTIEGLLDGKQRAEHPDKQQAPDLNFKKAKAEANAAQKELI
jgi:DNA modification methylase